MNRTRLLILTAALAIGGISAAAAACTRHPPSHHRHRATSCPGGHSGCLSGHVFGWTRKNYAGTSGTIGRQYDPAGGPLTLSPAGMEKGHPSQHSAVPGHQLKQRRWPRRKSSGTEDRTTRRSHSDLRDQRHPVQDRPGHRRP